MRGRIGSIKGPTHSRWEVVRLEPNAPISEDSLVVHYTSQDEEGAVAMMSQLRGRACARLAVREYLR